VIQAHRRYLAGFIQQWTWLKDTEARPDLGFYLVVDAELFRLDSVACWLDLAGDASGGPQPMILYLLGLSTRPRRKAELQG